MIQLIKSVLIYKNVIYPKSNFVVESNQRISEFWVCKRNARKYRYIQNSVIAMEMCN